MDFSIQSRSLEKNRNTCIVAGIFENRCFSSIVEEIDKISTKYISDILSRGEITGKYGQMILLHYIPNMFYEKVLLIGCGKEYELDEHRYKKIIRKVIKQLNGTSLIEASVYLSELNVKNRNFYWKIRQAVETIQELNYEFNQLKTYKITKEFNFSLQKIIFNAPNVLDIAIGEQAIQHGLAISEGIKAAKDLGNMPPNICNAYYLSSEACKLQEVFKKRVTTSVINEKQMQDLGMNAYLAVGNGSKNESLMSIIEYKGNALTNSEYPIVLIGKGVTFDSGGISIKPSKGLENMKYDMCGAAAVYGVMRVLIELKLPINVIGILAGCENMLGSQSYRVGDVLKTMSGKTVEVLNTDAEGRLVLCDVLTYVEQFNPEIVIDVATLTGACIIALGDHITGLISNHDLLANELIIASEQSGDLAWRLPLNNKFQEQLRSNCADIANVGGNSAGAITAGCFLSFFAKKYKWAHLDIAGTATQRIYDAGKVATGRPVSMLSQFLINRSSVDKNHK